MNTIMIVFVVICVTVILFLIMRNIAFWYLKINERIELHEETNKLLEKNLSS
jgi:ABC-type uncharacterized transport system permease subunit